MTSGYRDVKHRPIKGEYKEDEKFDEDKYQIRERRIGSIARSVTLPVGVKAEEIEATYASGILTLTVPKAEEVKPRRIQIKAGNNGNEPKTIEGEVGKSKKSRFLPPNKST